LENKRHPRFPAARVLGIRPILEVAHDRAEAKDLRSLAATKGTASGLQVYALFF
jgi:hypothetical protein